jgi:hypothetical protein
LLPYHNSGICEVVDDFDIAELNEDEKALFKEKELTK